MMTRLFSDRIQFEADGGADGGSLLAGNTPEGQVNNEASPAANQAPLAVQGEGQVQEPGWLSGLTADLRGNELVKQYAKPSDYVKESLGWKAQLENSIVKLPADATPEAIKAYRSALGVPETPEEYGLEADPIAGDEYLKAQIDMYHAQGLNKEQAKAVYNANVSAMKEGAAAIKRSNVEARAATLETLNKEFGDKAKQVINDASTALRRFATKEDMDYLNKTGLGNDAGLIRMFSRIQGLIGGDSLLGRSEQNTDSSIKSEIAKRFPNSPQMLDGIV